MLPQGDVPASPEGGAPESDLPAPEPYREVIRFRPRWSVRMRIMVFAVVVGGVLCVVMAFIASILVYASAPGNMFEGPRDLWINIFSRFAVGMAPTLMLVAAVAAAADALAKRSARATQQMAAEIADAFSQISRSEDRATPGRREDAGNSREPTINLEIDSRQSRYRPPSAGSS